jgi:septal ring factor EnvC (AmiA/AmiB activator)
MYIKILYSIFFALLVLAGPSVSAENTKQKQENLQKKIKSANANLQSSRAISNKLRKSVRASEDKLNELSRDLYQTDQSINHLTSKLTKSNKREKKLEKQTGEQKKALAQQMQALYTSGKQSHLRLLLKQDDPSDISRTVKYFEYMNKHRLKRIKKVKKRLSKIKQVQEQISKDSSVLKKLQLIQSKKKIALKSTVTEKDRLLKKQGKVVRSQEQKLSKLKRDESRLRGVIQKLAQKQKREEIEIAKEKARKKVKTTTLVVSNTKKTKSTKPAKVIERHYVSNRPFSSLKGKLSWPARGKLSHKYGSARNSKIKWNGVIISAAGGTNVHAVARGKVEFSGRLNGYGYVIIIRHDKSYRSLYAYNRSVYKRVGQIVKAGEIIAAVGNSGRLASPGLYFEISKGSVHQNPARWCR